MTRTKFTNKFPSEYHWMLRHKKLHLLNGILSLRKTRITKEECKIAAKKCKTRYEFQKRYRRAYFGARRLGILDEITKHMKIQQKWTKELCKIEALKHDTKMKFAKNGAGAYEFARKNGFLSEITVHIKSYKRKVKCVEQNKCFDSVRDAVKYTGGSIDRALRSGIKAYGYHWAYCDENGNVLSTKGKNK